MTSEGDLLLGQVLEHMCDRNDHETVLYVLQVLGKIRRAGYLNLDELVMCLIYCGNRFAEHGNCDFFREYVRYMPDFNNIQDTTRYFTPLCKSYFFAHKHAESLLYELQTDCMLLDINDLLPQFQQFIVDHKINSVWQLTPLLNKLREHKETVTNEHFAQLSASYQVPIQLHTGK